MKHGFFLFILVVIACLAGCKTRKSVQRNTHVESATERVEAAFDKSIKTERAVAQVRVSSTEALREFVRRTEFDTAGNVRAIQEAWRGSGRSQLAVRDDSSRSVSVADTGTSAVTIAKNDSTAAEKSDLKSDGRPVQGVEWLWIAIGAGVILIALILLYIPRRKTRNP